jgi:hydroxymethylpyrimidine pyrophosphatase-like HAD family hydrolase
MSAAPLLISTDFDGTIFGDYDTDLFPRFAAWLTETRRTRPVIWAINTGRNWEQLIQEFHRRDATLWPDYVILVERFIHEVHDREPGSFEEWNSRCLEVHADLFSTHAPVLKKIHTYAKTETDAHVVEDIGSPVGLIARSDEEADQIGEFLASLLPETPDLICVRNSVYFRFAHRSYHKGSCLQALAEALKIPREHIFAAGDHWNDLPMLCRDVAAHVMCPGNAIEDVKRHVRQQGGYVASGEREVGVVEGLRYFFP